MSNIIYPVSTVLFPGSSSMGSSWDQVFWTLTWKTLKVEYPPVTPSHRWSHPSHHPSHSQAPQWKPFFQGGIGFGMIQPRGVDPSSQMVVLLNVTLESIRDDTLHFSNSHSRTSSFFPEKSSTKILPPGYESYGKCLKKKQRLCFRQQTSKSFSRSTNSYTPLLIRLGIHLEEHLQILHHRLARR